MNAKPTALNSLPGELYNGFTKANISNLLILLHITWVVKQNLLLFLKKTKNIKLALQLHVWQVFLITRVKKKTADQTVNYVFIWNQPHLSFPGSKCRVVNEKTEQRWCVLFLLHSWGHPGTVTDTERKMKKHKPDKKDLLDFVYQCQPCIITNMFALPDHKH